VKSSEPKYFVHHRHPLFGHTKKNKMERRMRCNRR